MSRMIDIKFLTMALRLLSALTGLNFALYDETENCIIPPAREDRLLSSIKMNEKEQKSYNDFLSRYRKLTIEDAKPYIVQRFTLQYQVFIPIRHKEVNLVAMSDGFYMAKEDFAKFHAKWRERQGLTGRSAGDLAGGLKFIDSHTMGNHINLIKPLFENILSSGYERGELNKRWQWARTIIGLAANLKTDASFEDISRMMVETVIFLFNADTAAVFSLNKGVLHPESADGRRRKTVLDLRLSKDNELVSEAMQGLEPVSETDGHKLRYYGVPGDINSIYLFPIEDGAEFFGFLGIFNSSLEREAFEAVEDICRLWAYLFGVKKTKGRLKEYSKGLDLVSAKISALFKHYKDQQALCDEIVNESAALIGAEKCSLMLPDEDGDVLKIASVKGANKVLMKDVRVKSGEGIAGKVFKQGAPVLIDNEEKLKAFFAHPRSMFKTKSCMSVPLSIDGETLGTLNLSDKVTGGLFTAEDLAILTPFVKQAAIILKLNGCHRVTERGDGFLSARDPVSGFFDRRLFDVLLEKEYQRARRYDLHFSLAIIEIDDLKALTGREGSIASEYILREVAGVMGNSIRADDTPVRFGVEELAIIMSHTGKDGAIRALERIRSGVSAMPFPDVEGIRSNISVMRLQGVKGGEAKNITISAGIAMFPECGPIGNILKQARSALYSAKTRGKNHTVPWDNSLELKPF